VCLVFLGIYPGILFVVGAGLWGGEKDSRNHYIVSVGIMYDITAAFLAFFGAVLLILDAVGSNIVPPTGA
jgi:hypothetical protein